MRRLARRLFTLCSAVSLVLCVAVCVLWIRSYERDDGIEWGASYDTGFGWHLRGHAVAFSVGALYYVRSQAPGVAQAGGARSERHQRFGFLLASGLEQLVPGSDFAAHRVTVGVPCWAVVLATAALPVGRSWRRLRRRRAAGLCASCGYDLRASPERCPECGAAAG